MAKLIFAATLTKFETLHPQYNVSTDASYGSIAFTGDGYLVTRGNVYQLALNSSTNPYNLIVSTTNGTLSVSVGGATKTAPVLVGAANGNNTTAHVTGGVVSFDHNAIVENTGTGVGATAASNSAINVPGFKYDSYGHITIASDHVATLNDVLQTVGTGTYYLLGTDTQTTGTRQTYFDTRVSIVNGVLNVQGDTSIKLGATTLADYVQNAINTVTSQAMIYKGSLSSQAEINALAVSTAKVGDTYKIATAGTYTVNGGSVTLEVGDTLITSSVTTVAEVTTVTYDILQANIDGAVIASNNLTGVLYGSGTHSIASIGNGASGQFLKSAGANAPVWESFSSLTLFGQTYNPESALTITAGNGLTMSGTKLVHSNSVTAQTIEGLYPVKIDAQGHISAYGSAVTSLKNPNALTFTNGTDSLVYNGQTAYSIHSGTNISFGISEGVLTISSSYVNTTYRMIVGASTGLVSSAVSNPYLRLLDNSNGDEGTFHILGSGATTVTSDASGNLTIGSSNTWRPILGYASGASSVATTGSDTLQFGKDFKVTDNGSESEISISWEIIDADGNVTYE